MSRCLITCRDWSGPGAYSPEGLRQLDRRLQRLEPLTLTAAQLLEEAQVRAGRMSIQGIQPKLSAVLRVTAGRIDLVDAQGRFILKPPHPQYPELPENEALTMSLARTVGFDVPLHGLLLGADGVRVYFVRRFDRAGRGRLPVEDFAQLSGASRDTKYDSSTEQLVGVIDSYCSFPAIERVRLLERIVFSFLTGNEDMHLKNWSLLTRDGRVGLAPAYDLVNSSIALGGSNLEELALPLGGKKSKFKASAFWKYLAVERLQLPTPVLAEVQARFRAAVAGWPDQIAASFLSEEMRGRYLALVRERYHRLELGALPA